MCALIPLLSNCSKTEVVKETVPVTVYVEKFRDYDFSQIRCEVVDIQAVDTWLEVVINQKEMIALCVADILTIRKTINTNSP